MHHVRARDRCWDDCHIYCSPAPLCQQGSAPPSELYLLTVYKAPPRSEIICETNKDVAIGDVMKPFQRESFIANKGMYLPYFGWLWTPTRFLASIRAANTRSQRLPRKSCQTGSRKSIFGHGFGPPHPIFSHGFGPPPDFPLAN